MDVIIYQVIMKHALSAKICSKDAFTVKLHWGLSNASQIQVRSLFFPIISEEI